MAKNVAYKVQLEEKVHRSKAGKRDFSIKI